MAISINGEAYRYINRPCKPISQDNFRYVIRQAKSKKDTVLEFVGCEIEVLPRELFDLKDLKFLDLSGNLLKTLPPEIGNLENLEELDLSGNRITSLPPEIGKLKKLRRLNLNAQAKIAFDAGLQNRDKYKRGKDLDPKQFGSNELTVLPSEIVQLSNLKILVLTGNPLPIPPEILEKVDEPQYIMALK